MPIQDWISPISSGISAISQGIQNRKQRKHERSMYQQQYKDSVAFWNMQNEYNTPLQQGKRLEEGGYNKLLPFVSGNSPQNTAQAPNVPEQKAATLPSAYSGNALIDYMGIRLQKAGINKTEEETRSIKLQTARNYLDYLNEKKHSAENAGNKAEIIWLDKNIKSLENQIKLDEFNNYGVSEYGTQGRFNMEKKLEDIQNVKQARQLIIQQTENARLQNKRLKEFEKLLKNMPEGSESLQTILWMILSK